jgi:RNA-directed DNA polymerase
VRFLSATRLVVGFEHESDARRFWGAMREWLQEFSLSLHPEKTRLIEFGRHAAARRAQRGVGKPETFNFLGFRFICGTSRRGRFLLKRKSQLDRMRVKLKEIKEELRKRMHQPITEQGAWLKQVVAGYFNYQAVPTNGRALSSFRIEVTRRWQQVLGRRSQNGAIDWVRMTKLVDDYLHKPRILHPWPDKRFAVKHPR